MPGVSDANGHWGCTGRKGKVFPLAWRQTGLYVILRSPLTIKSSRCVFLPDWSSQLEWNAVTPRNVFIACRNQTPVSFCCLLQSHWCPVLLSVAVWQLSRFFVCCILTCPVLLSVALWLVSRYVVCCSLTGVPFCCLLQSNWCPILMHVAFWQMSQFDASCILTGVPFWSMLHSDWFLILMHVAFWLVSCVQAQRFAFRCDRFSRCSPAIDLRLFVQTKSVILFALCVLRILYHWCLCWLHNRGVILHGMTCIGGYLRRVFR